MAVKQGLDFRMRTIFDSVIEFTGDKDLKERLFAVKEYHCIFGFLSELLS